MLRIVPRLDWRDVWVYDVLLANKTIQRDYLSHERAAHFIHWALARI